MMELLFRKIFIISVKLGFCGKDKKECQSIALKIKRSKTIHIVLTIDFIG
jgi:hypothetical protein